MVILFPILPFFVQYSLAQLVPRELLNGTPFTETSFRRFQEKMARLGDIQQKIFHRGSRYFPLTNDVVEDGKNHPEEQPFLYQGDIMITDDQFDDILKNAENILKDKKRLKRSSNKVELWSLPIPFYIDQSVTDSSSIISAIQMWERSTCITFKRLYNEPTNRNAIIFKQLSGCWSFVGQTGIIPQIVSVGIGCEVPGIVAHEIGHAVGLFHEQSRFDRDEFVKILANNISPSQLNQFNIEPKELASGRLSYDYGSIMHYAQNAFSSKSSLVTVSTVDPNFQQTIGQRMKLSFSDIKKTNLAYCSETCHSTLDCQNGGYADPKNCSKCRCPDGFGGTFCEKSGECASQCGRGDLEATAEFQAISEKGLEHCNYVIKAPEDKKILFEVVSFNFTASPICWLDFLELKYDLDMAPTGARLCSSFPSRIVSKGNKLAVIYQGSKYTRFAIRYRYDPIDEMPRPSTTHQPETGTNLSTSSSTTTEFTTTPKPIKVTHSQRITAATFFPQTTTPIKGIRPFFLEKVGPKSQSRLYRFFHQ